MSAYKRFFEQEINDFYKNDLSSCLEVSRLKQQGNDQKSFPGGLNFTAGLAIFCVLEMTTSFFKGKVKKKNGGMEESSADDVADFLIKYFSPFCNIFSNREFSKKFYEVFRHGLVHEFSPKASAIAMDFSYEEPIGLVLDNDEDLMTINIPKFFEISLKAYSLYERDLDSGQFIKEFDKHYLAMIDNDYREMRTLRDLFSRLKN